MKVEEKVCSQCGGGLRNSSAVGEFCKKFNSSFVLEGRCCLQRHGEQELIVGALPQLLDCPGGNTSWEHVDIFKTWLCPENSLCQPDGPGMFQCACASSYYGYKCLKEGAFPMLEFFGILGPLTVLTSALLWLSQRRKAKSS
ncbi:UNVERIFIED_CONTAM: hypothetical protein FKN15_045372 [Acipenser sinensis]